MNVLQYVMYVKDYWFGRDISNHKYQYQCLSYYFSVICDVCPQYVTGVSVRIKTLIPHLSIKTSRVQQKESAYGLHLCVWEHGSLFPPSSYVRSLVTADSSIRKPRQTAQNKIQREKKFLLDFSLL